MKVGPLNTCERHWGANNIGGQRKERQRDTTGGIAAWSPTVVLVTVSML